MPCENTTKTLSHLYPHSNLQLIRYSKHRTSFYALRICLAVSLSTFMHTLTSIGVGLFVFSASPIAKTLMPELQILGRLIYTSEWSTTFKVVRELQEDLLTFEELVYLIYRTPLHLETNRIKFHDQSDWKREPLVRTLYKRQNCLQYGCSSELLCNNRMDTTSSWCNMSAYLSVD